MLRSNLPAFVAGSAGNAACLPVSAALASGIDDPNLISFRGMDLYEITGQMTKLTAKAVA